MSEFMLWLSGVDRDVLSHCERERSKFVAMGGTVLTTAVLAFLAAVFTLNRFVHAPLFFALALGFLWALAIMNLDRWLLISIRRQSTTGRTIALAAPRVILAVLIGAVIAHPLVLQVFDKEIQAQAVRDKSDGLRKGEEALRKQYAAIPTLKSEAEELRADLTDVDNGELVEEAPEYREAAGELRRLEKKEANAQHAALCELDGRCGSSEEGAGPIYQAKKAKADSLQAQVAAQQERVAAIRGRLQDRETNQAGQARRFDQRELRRLEAQESTLVEKRDDDRENLEQKFGARVGLLDRVTALDNLTFERPEMLLIEILLFLFILAIDAMPAIAKVLMCLGTPSLYEIVQGELEEADTVALREQTKAHAKASELEASSVIDEAMTRKVLMKEVQDDLVRQSVEAMREAGEKFVALWREAIVERVPRMVRRELERNGMGGNGQTREGGGPPPSAGNGSGAARKPRS
jgi:hypothetical protein